jgi:hypothetical protein
MLSKVWELIRKYNPNKILIDGANPSFIRSLKIQLGEDPDYDNVIARYKSRKLSVIFFGLSKVLYLLLPLRSLSSIRGSLCFIITPLWGTVAIYCSFIKHRNHRKKESINGEGIIQRIK